MSDPLSEKLTKMLAAALEKLDDFDSAEKASEYAEETIAELRAKSGRDPATLRDAALAIISNVSRLNTLLRARGIAPARLAALNEVQIAAMVQSGEELRRRARELENYDKTGLHCRRCGAVRQNRLNSNQLGLDSEEGGSHFDYDFGDMCNCSSSSSSSASDTDADADAEVEAKGEDALARPDSRDDGKSGDGLAAVQGPTKRRRLESPNDAEAKREETKAMDAPKD